MAASKEYAYQIKGNQLVLLEKDVTTGDDGLNYTYTPGAGLNVSSSRVQYKSPVENSSSGLEIEFTYIPASDLKDENDDIDLPSYLSKALVYYVKAKLSEDARDIDGKEYFMIQFRKMLEKYQNARVAGPRRMMPGVGAIR
tara:strand:- start:49 stop:471 length:423 start_codon:yes stop_codon:yes gene_type:complete